MLETFTLNSVCSFHDGTPGDEMNEFYGVTVTFKSGHQMFIWVPNSMSALDFSTTMTWMRERIAGLDPMTKVEFDR